MHEKAGLCGGASRRHARRISAYTLPAITNFAPAARRVVGVDGSLVLRVGRVEKCDQDVRVER